MNKQNGFSLIELIVTLAIAAIVLSIGIPSFQAYIQNNRQTIAINELVTALQLARNNAITQRVPVTLCKSADTAAATPTCSTGGGSGDWSQGWILFTNPNNDTTLDPGETLLRVHGPLQGEASFIGTGPVVNQVTFTPQGRISNGFGGTINLCDSRGAEHAKALVISLGGQVRQATDSDGDNIVENGNGDPVSCP
ncbi:MAG TPA: prepilin-type N-terminal cleavage/methylation domain-containing protein [Gammaproteobacteria bacterium]|nr:prepilin-type N-terminal cleavage/methylation domain-containing protein [Gammaproteobacteria bacterium]